MKSVKRYFGFAPQETPTPGQWGVTPVLQGEGATPLGLKKRSRWDSTPLPGDASAASASATPVTAARFADGSESASQTPHSTQTPGLGATPLADMASTPGETPLAMTGEALLAQDSVDSQASPARLSAVVYVWVLSGSSQGWERRR